jgi:amylosucrase
MSYEFAASLVQPKPSIAPARSVLERRLALIYGEEAPELLHRVLDRVHAAAAERPAPLKALDVQREQEPDWTQRSGETVYTFYVDRMTGTLSHLIDKLDYLQTLGVKWLHPLPLLKAREGDSDGGFAVADYRAVDPRLGTIADLERLAMEAKSRGMGLFLDVVCNHTAREHDWAIKARAGDPRYRAYYHTVSGPTEVEAWEAGLADVFPDTAPGSFTWDEELAAFVWTTFYPFQWDLNYANPDVFVEMLDILLFLANRGVQGFRLDSAPFLWKRPGTNCRNQAEAYWIVEALRAALDLAAPGVVLLAEAIESLEDVLPFFGEEAPGCGLAYNNGVMTALWGGLADADAGIVRTVMAAAAARPDHAAWLNYVRCHDDLIWNALSAYAPKEDLKRWSDFYGGEGFSLGQPFQTTPGGAPSTNGMASALVGWGKPGVDQDLALSRLKLMYGVIHALDGWPLIYMGDEILLENDEGYRLDPTRRMEGRWLHRPEMNWEGADVAHRTHGPSGSMFKAVRRFGEAARELNALNVRGRALPFKTGDDRVLGFKRTESRAFICLANLSAEPVLLAKSAWAGPGLDVLTHENMPVGPIELRPYQVIWWAAQP